MLRRHLAPIASITRAPSLEYRVRQYFDLGSRPFLIELSRARLCHADIVLCLIRINTRRAREIVEALINKPITVAPACRLVWLANTQAPRVREQPQVTWVSPQWTARRKTRLSVFQCEFKVGRSLSQLRSRGVTKGDLRRAVREGLVRVAGDV